MSARDDFTLGDAIAKARKLADLDQTDLADRLGVTTKTIGRWEADTCRVPFDAIVRIAHLTGKPVTWFADFVAVPPLEPAGQTADPIPLKSTQRTKRASSKQIRSNPCSIGTLSLARAA